MSRGVDDGLQVLLFGSKTAELHCLLAV